MLINMDWFIFEFQVIGQFIARAIADDCIAPKYVTTYKGCVDDQHKQAALDKAELLLSRKHGIVRLDNIWGTGGGIRPVKYLVKQVSVYFGVLNTILRMRKIKYLHFKKTVVIHTLNILNGPRGQLALVKANKQIF